MYEVMSGFLRMGFIKQNYMKSTAFISTELLREKYMVFIHLKMKLKVSLGNINNLLKTKPKLN